jgi:hypothetical protein
MSGSRHSWHLVVALSSVVALVGTFSAPSDAGQPAHHLTENEKE